MAVLSPHFQLFEVHGSKLKPDPVRYPVKPLVQSVALAMLFFGARKYEFNCLTSQTVVFTSGRTVAKVFGSVNMMLPDMLGYHLLMIDALRARATWLSRCGWRWELHHLIGLWVLG